MKIMIVEDEDNIREGLVSLLDWKEAGFDPPVLFGGAIEALEYLETEKVDVILTDIYMPVLSGLEFIKMIRKENLTCDIIILTGHDRFEFAQEAVELGVKRYLLKPVSPEKLKQVLADIRQDIAERMKLMDWIAIAEKQLEEYLPVLRNQFWNDLLGERFADREQLELGAQKASVSLPKREITCVAIRHFHQDSSLTKEVALRQIVDEILGDAAIYLMPYDGTELVIMEGRLFQFKLEIMKESIAQNLGLDVCFGISKMGKEPLTISRLAREAVEAAKSIRDIQEVYYLYFADIALKRVGEPEYPYADEKQILDMLRFHDTLNDRLLQTFFHKIMPPKYPVEESQVMLFQLLVAMNRTANDMGIDELDEFRDTQSSIMNFEGIEAAFHQMAERMIQKKRNSTRRYVEVIAEQVKEIVDREYSNPDLSVNSLADRLALTSNYLSRIFRSTTGETCIEYITKVRMNAAMEMLEHTDKKSYVIAGETGYKNANYFSAMFKKYTGLSPKEYRERRKG